MLKNQKSLIAAVIPLLFFSTVNAGPMGDYQHYVGVFGGGGGLIPSNNPSLTQKGTVFFPASIGGPLIVNANGHPSTSADAGFGGGQFGLEFGKLPIPCSCWKLLPAAEIEGYYLRSTLRGSLPNPNTLRLEQNFFDTLPLYTGVFLVNTVWGIDIPKNAWGTPYFGGGIGTSVISISNAYSAQLTPAEPGINHFNSGRSATAWAFAAQAKAGLNFALNCHWRLFAEYRYLFVSETNYTFGRTAYPGRHVPTSKWTVGIGNTNYSLGAAGIQYTF